MLNLKPNKRQIEVHSRVSYHINQQQEIISRGIKGSSFLFCFLLVYVTQETNTHSNKGESRPVEKRRNKERKIVERRQIPVKTKTQERSCKPLA